MRKEQVVLIGTVVVLGLLVWRSSDTGRPGRVQVKRAPAPELVKQDVPDPALVLPSKRDPDPAARDLFSEPKDTRPLPPLDLETPPIVPFAALRPPTVPGPSPASFGKFLRARVPHVKVPDLFVDAADTSDSPVETPPPAVAATPTKITSAGSLTPEQIAAQLASRKKLYDWVRIGDYHFGQIRNSDRYNLARRPNEDILFVEFNPETGQPRFPGQAPAPIPRKTVNDFDFAQTIPNQIEIRRARLSDPLSINEYDEALMFAAWCLEQRLETPRALEVAEEIFTRASKLMGEEALPRLGLARVHEAKFEFEKAFQQYKDLIGGTLKGNPLVLGSLAQLEARFLMFDKAEAHLREAERLGRSNWRVQEALGRFLLDRGRAQEAVEHLRIANQYEPQEAEAKRFRARLRTGLGAALIATGELAEGRSWIEKALQADPTDVAAQAALIQAGVLASNPGSSNGGAAPAPGDGAGEAQGFDLLFAHGMAQLAERTPESLKLGKDSLVAAAAADPLRAYLPWRTLSFLAERTDYPEEAWRYVEMAHENNPLDAWTLFQRGRLAVARDDVDGAIDSFRQALDRDIGFVDALAWLGELARRRNDHAAAERYFERTLMLDPSMTDVMAIRGVNFLEMGAFKDAEETFRKVLAADQDQPTARIGLAWCYYRRGDPTEALQRFRDVDDNRRALPEDDPYRVYARAQIERITDHIEKVAWTDRFERNPPLGNGWQVAESFGPTVSLHDGVVTLGGTFKSAGRARMYKLLAASDFVAIEARLTIKGGTTSRVGMFVSREMQRANETTVNAEVTVSRHKEPGKNTIQTRIMKQGQEELEYTDVTGFEWRTDVPVLVRIERTGSAESPTVRILVDGIPVLDDKSISSLGHTQNELRMGVFAEGQIGSVVQVDVDDVEIVQRGGRNQ